jgi:hypothetical protein
MQTGEPVTVSAVAAPGEPVRVALLARTQRRGAATTTVPFPIENVSEGCHLQVMLGMKDAGMVLVDGSGFPPNTPLHLSSITDGQTRELNSKTNAKGRMVFVLLPRARGRAAGETTVRFDGVIQAPTLDPADKAPTPKVTCRPAVTFHWGQGSYKPE